MTPRSPTRGALGALLAAALVGGGCTTLDTRADPGYRGPRVYSGARTDLSNLGAGTRDLAIDLVLMSLLDLPLAVIADTLLLPVSIPEELRRTAEREERLRTDRDVPSPWRDRGGDPIGNARRLFKACAGFVEVRSPDLTDCYAIDARVHLTGAAGGAPRGLSGAEYKRLIRESLAALDRASFQSLRDPSYALEGERVRIEATHVASFTDGRHAVSWVVGLGDDGYWRILEAIGPGWP